MLRKLPLKSKKLNKSKAITLMVSDDFLKQENINITEEDWNRLARGINGRNISIPAITSLLLSCSTLAVRYLLRICFLIIVCSAHNKVGKNIGWVMVVIQV
ncbi:hypothetical protein [Anaerocolumna sp. MB42-C2]|uniref:hypothetical protein n=1 Tax=Anaerocolumna sp. MB42-C2 TaxID=3070997 RepID=UPI0027DF3EE3|nr:hypothetical protein [Anaerocolumna sp. MB42-C2]WMJ86847.1 hypothetical protein RBU59_22855 [Anaerocolumna sp. MB42-C2]